MAVEEQSLLICILVEGGGSTPSCVSTWHDSHSLSERFQRRILDIEYDP